jgi:hypothetical protein
MEAFNLDDTSQPSPASSTTPAAAASAVSAAAAAGPSVEPQPSLTPSNDKPDSMRVSCTPVLRAMPRKVGSSSAEVRVTPDRIKQEGRRPSKHRKAVKQEKKSPSQDRMSALIAASVGTASMSA